MTGSPVGRLSFANLRGDLFGGVTTAVVSLPLALAFGVASGAGAEAGLYGAVMVGLFAALFGGTNTLISEPTGPMTVIMTAVLTAMIADNPENGFAMAFTVVMIAGAFQILFGVLKLGKYITLMPYAVISGFMSGIGIILILLQLAPFLGQATPAGGAAATLAALPDLVSDMHPVATTLGIATLAVLLFYPGRWARYLPAQLVALVLGTLASVAWLGNTDIARVGIISIGLPELVLPAFTPEQITAMVLDGLILGMLGCIDTLLTAVIADSLTRTDHDSNRELIGQGIGNMMSGLCGGLPGAGATMGTVVNIQTGARTALAGVIRAVVLIVVIFGAAGLTSHIPLAVLAAIAIKVGLDILDWSFLKRAHRLSLPTALIMYGVLLLTVFVDLIMAVGVGVFIANVLTIERLSEVQARNVHAISDADDALPLSAEDRSVMEAARGRVLLFYLSGPMIFGVTKAIARQHAQIREHAAMVVDLTSVPMLDVTVALALENAIRDSLDAGCRVYVAARDDEVRRQLASHGLEELLGKDLLLETRLEALKRAVSELPARTPRGGLVRALPEPARPAETTASHRLPV